MDVTVIHLLCNLLLGLGSYYMSQNVAKLSQESSNEQTDSISNLRIAENGILVEITNPSMEVKILSESILETETNDF